jgi:hypothetical protein
MSLLTDHDTILFINNYIPPNKYIKSDNLCKCCNKKSYNLEKTHADSSYDYLYEYLYGWYHCKQCNDIIKQSLKLYNKVIYLLSPVLFGYNDKIKILRSNGKIIKAKFIDKFHYSKIYNDFIINVYWFDNKFKICEKEITLKNVLKLNPLKIIIDINNLYDKLIDLSVIHFLNNEEIIMYCNTIALFN